MKENHKHNEIGRRVKELKEKLGKTEKIDELFEKYNGLDYEMQCAIKGAVKKVVKVKLGYHWSPSLKNARSKVLV